MNNTYKSKNSSNELNMQVEQHLEELAKMTDQARTSKEMLRYLDFCAKFHNYSSGNVWLIMINKPDASFVAGYRKWQSLGRWVRKGECGIPILAPVLVKEEDEDGAEQKRLAGFKTVYVFDISQTEGQDLPEPPDWKSPEKNQELNQRLIQFANHNGITVEFVDLERDTQGISMGGKIIIDLSAGTKTLIHEISHELMHKNDNNHQSRALKELEAESVAFIVSRHFGISGLNSPNYIALHDISPREIGCHIDRIVKTASSIISNITANDFIKEGTAPA